VISLGKSSGEACLEGPDCLFDAFLESPGSQSELCSLMQSGVSFSDPLLCGHSGFVCLTKRMASFLNKLKPTSRRSREYGGTSL